MGRPLPKFGEWDVNNPASAEGFTMIFTRARDQKMINGPADNGTPAPSSTKPVNNQYPQEVINLTTLFNLNMLNYILVSRPNQLV